MKNNTAYLDPMIKIIEKKIGKLISDEQLESLQKDFLGPNFDKKKFYKLIYRLKQRGWLVSLRKDLYLISYPENKTHNHESHTELFYRTLLQEKIKQLCKKKYYIGGQKGCELHLNNQSIDESIEIFYEGKNQEETIIHNYKAQFKTYHSKGNKGNHNCFTLGLKHSTSTNVGGIEFNLGPVELCVLETLYYCNSISYPTDSLKKIIKKYNLRRNRELTKEIIKSGRHHTSLNRLLDISKYIDDKFAQKCKELIQQYGYRISI